MFVGVGASRVRDLFEEAKKNFFKVPMVQRSIPHPVQGEMRTSASDTSRTSSSAQASSNAKRTASATPALRPRARGEPLMMSRFTSVTLLCSSAKRWPGDPAVRAHCP